MEITSTKLILNDLNTLFVNKKSEIRQISKVLSNEKRIKLLELSDGRLIRKEIEDRLGLYTNSVSQHLNLILSLPNDIRLLRKIKEGASTTFVRNYDYILIAL